MKIAILGTRGIPNNYGGFEQLAQCLSVGLKNKGHEVSVYNSHSHPYKQPTWNGINIIHQYDPEYLIGSAGQFIYDLNCILNSRSHGFDVILNLGYTSSSIWLKLFRKNTLIITNMDGLEWKRSKFSPLVRRFLMFAEKLAVRNSDLLVADSTDIKNYLEAKYGVTPHFIAYGARQFSQADPRFLAGYALAPFAYNMLVARMEPENNIEMILDGVQSSDSQTPILVVSNHANKYGKFVTARYAHDRRIVFIGPVYDEETINNLRYHCNIYFHGHSVGGTNPSLLEAMACRCLIAAHDNNFNKAVLHNNAYFFENQGGVRRILETINRVDERHVSFIANNYDKIGAEYAWNKIIDEYEKLMLENRAK